MEKFPQLLNQKDSHGSTAMHYACKYNNTEVEKILLSHDNCQINVHDDEHQNPLHYASKRGNLKYLLSLNCSVNVQDVNGKTPLHLASMYFNVEIIKELLQRDGTLLNQQDKDGRTPLHCVFEDVGSYVTTRYETVSCLLNFPECDINLTDNKGNTPLHLAAWRLYDDDDDKILHLFIQRDGLLLNAENNMGQTALHLAAIHCNSEEIKVFLSHKECKTNAQDKNGYTPLHSCIQRGIYNEAIMNTIINLIKHDFSILNIKNNKGQTPLHVAVEEHELKVVDLLVRLGAEVNIKDNDNRTPLKLA
ncbi:hypothetical protein B566_EDAN016902, partial [Ephemera danica]